MCFPGAVWPWVLWPLVAIAALVAGFFLLMFVTALVERMPVHVFAATPMEAFPADLPAYVTAMNAAAARHGFEFGGIYPHAKGGIYRAWAAVWFAPDRRSVAVIAGGTIARLPHKASFLASRTADGRQLVTKDEFDAGDYSGIVETERLVNASFDELWAAHQERLWREQETIEPFDEPTPYEAFAALMRERVERTVARGYGRRVDADHTAWKYTLPAAVRICTTNFFGDLRKYQSQADRSSRPRPGDGGGVGGFSVVYPPAGPTPPPPPPRQRSVREFLP